MKMTQQIIDHAKVHHACDDGITWGKSLIGQEITMENAIPNYVLWLCHIGTVAEPELIDWCAEKNFCAALAYAAKHLTSERLDWCASRDAWRALQYAAKQLTPQCLDWCAEDQPYAAIEYASELLTPQRLQWCKKQVAA